MIPVVAMALPFLKKYVFEIIAVVAITAAVGIVWYNVNNWCNGACKDAREEKHDLEVELATCAVNAQKQLELYNAEREKWVKEVERMNEEIAALKSRNEEAVKQSRRKFENIFKEQKKNEQRQKERVAVQIRPTDTVVAPLALVREYNESVASSFGPSGDSGGKVWVPEDSSSLVGKVGTFDAVAVAEALLDNLNKYHKLAARCDALVDLVLQLEKTNAHAESGVQFEATRAGLTSEFQEDIYAEIL